MFSIILFLICFCLASIAMYEPESEFSTTVDSFDQFYSAVKEVFSEEPEDEPAQRLSGSQTDAHYQPTEIIANPVVATTAVVEPVEPTPQFTIRELRDYVRNSHLQAMIKEQLGKSVNHCRT